MISTLVLFTLNYIVGFSFPCFMIKRIFKFTKTISRSHLLLITETLFCNPILSDDIIHLLVWAEIWILREIPTMYIIHSDLFFPHEVSVHLVWQR